MRMSSVSWTTVSPVGIRTSRHAVRVRQSPPRGALKVRTILAAPDPTDELALDTMKVAVYSSQPYMKGNINKLLRNCCTNGGSAECGVHIFDTPLNPRTALMAQDCDAVNIFVNDDCGKETLEVLQRMGVKLVTLRCAGFDRVDVDAAYNMGLRVARVPTYSPESIAEHALALLLCLSRSLHQAYIRTHLGNFSLSGLVGFEIHGRTVGIIGTGNIGLAAARIFKGFGTKLIAFDPYGSEKAAKEIGFEYVSLDELLGQSDIISLHCPLLHSTNHMINKESIAKMREGIVLINTSRGGLVDTDDVIEGLRNGQIGGYAADVYENERDLFFQDFSAESVKERMQHWDAKFNELIGLPNVLVTPHEAFLTEEALLNIAETTVLNLQEFCEGKEVLSNEVLPKGGTATHNGIRA